MAFLLDRRPFLKEKHCRVARDVQDWIDHPPSRVGPFLKFEDCQDDVWKGTVLFAVRGETVPIVRLGTKKGDVLEEWSNNPQPEPFLFFEAWNFKLYRFRLRVVRTDDEMVAAYSVVHDEYYKIHEFHVPGKCQVWRWAFYSCNGLSHTTGYKGYPEKYGSIVPMWTDLAHHHHRIHYHLLVGVGDQIYNDEVFEHAPTLNKWTWIADRKRRESMPCPPGLEEEVDRWVFHHYLFHFSRPFFADALAKIPNLMVSSDHDFVDGAGSLNPELEMSPVMLATMAILKRYYLIFQCHTGANRDDEEERYIGATSYSFVKQLGRDVTLMGLDTRFERTRTQILSQESYDLLFDRLDAVPETTKHLIVATEIPLIFPDLKRPEKVLRWIEKIKRKPWFSKLFEKVHWYKNIGFPFGEPMLLSDMIDHWNSECHIAERNVFIHRLQDFSRRTSIRVSFITGDVHCCGIGRLATPSKDRDPIRRHYENNMLLPLTVETDHRFMLSVCSSAIANVPPPAWIIKAYHIFDRSEKIVNAETGEITDGRMLRFFLRDTKGRLFGKKAKKLMGLRNWCSVEMMSTDNSLFFELYVEMFMGAGKSVKYNILVPALEVVKEPLEKEQLEDVQITIPDACINV